jgi:hypothetical protein
MARPGVYICPLTIEKLPVPCGAAVDDATEK